MLELVPEPVWKTSIGNCVVVLARGDLARPPSSMAARLLGVEDAELAR